MRGKDAGGASAATSIGKDDKEKEGVTPPTTAVTRKVRLTLKAEEDKWCFCHQPSYGNVRASFSLLCTKK